RAYEPKSGTTTTSGEPRSRANSRCGSGWEKISPVAWHRQEYEIVQSLFNMTLGFNFPFRPVLVVAAAIIFARATSAQPGEGTDPFVMMRGSLGAQTQSPSQYPRLDL